MTRCELCYCKVEHNRAVVFGFIFCPDCYKKYKNGLTPERREVTYKSTCALISHGVIWNKEQMAKLW